MYINLIMTDLNTKSSHKLMTKSCQECRGTGFVLATKNKQYCLKCKDHERCYLCENVPRLGKYDYCNKCNGEGYTVYFEKVEESKKETK